MTDANEMMKITNEGRRKKKENANKRARKLIKRMRKEALNGCDYCYVASEQLDDEVIKLLTDAGYVVENRTSHIKKIGWKR